eukprot:CAMPEP_0170500106 /NCGR_PEP_ID=MMETSP0208-20121228/33746_1 /TAXON_ID=197538 /ORGANISM="Strombidium inclinatum, Strain S3" /LENGTH=42 /DNA_ID= /DNA_START= /DNA_END= /DNA_ORIENTATION=
MTVTAGEQTLNKDYLQTLGPSGFLMGIGNREQQYARHLSVLE